jgi:hypothetical protein
LQSHGIFRVSECYEYVLSVYGFLEDHIQYQRDLCLLSNHLIHSYDTRSCNKFRLRSCISNVGLDSVYNSVVKVYNNLPTKLKQITSLDRFMIAMKEHIFLINSVFDLFTI